MMYVFYTSARAIVIGFEFLVFCGRLFDDVKTVEILSFNGGHCMIPYTIAKKGLLVTSLSIIVAVLAMLNIKLYIDQQELRSVLSKQSDSIPGKEIKVVEKIVSHDGFSWREVQSKFKNTVVQVFSQVAAVDLLEPYRTPNQYQGTGSAFFINNEGELITNAHVLIKQKQFGFKFLV